MFSSSTSSTTSTDVEEIPPFRRPSQRNQHPQPRPDDDEYTDEEYDTYELNEEEEVREVDDPTVQSDDEFNDPADQNVPPGIKDYIDGFEPVEANQYNVIGAVLDHIRKPDNREWFVGRATEERVKKAYRPFRKQDAKFCVRFYLTYQELDGMLGGHVARHPDYYPEKEGDPTPVPITPQQEHPNRYRKVTKTRRVRRSQLGQKRSRRGRR